jgi:alpha-L-fucosidase
VPGGTSAGLNSGERPGSHWIPAECDVSIRPGWFYHAKEDDKVKTPSQLVKIYYQSVGRGACLNLNLPPDRRGQIHENDIKSLKEFKRIIDATFAKNLAGKAKITASNIRGGDKNFATKNLLDGNRSTYWTTDDEIVNPEISFYFKRPITFNVVSIREYLPLGQRVEEFTVECMKEGKWAKVAQGTSIGNLRLLRVADTTTEAVRLRITKAPVCPALSEIGLYAEPSLNQK